MSQVQDKDLEEFWLKSLQETIKESIHILDETAKQLIGVCGLLIGFYTTAIGFGRDLKDTLSLLEAVLYLAPPLLWVCGLGLAIVQIWPRYSEIDDIRDAVEAKSFLQNTARRKKYWLRLAGLCVIGGVGLSLYVVAQYVLK